jgi:hypothetical protein
MIVRLTASDIPVTYAVTAADDEARPAGDEEASSSSGAEVVSSEEREAVAAEDDDSDGAEASPFGAAEGVSLIPNGPWRQVCGNMPKSRGQRSECA